MKKLTYVFVGLLTIGSLALLPSCKKDKCKDVTCQNGGTCDEDDGSCICATGYEGANCETAMRTKFIDDFTGSETCTMGSDNYVLEIEASSSAIDKIVVKNIYNQGFTAVGTLTGSASFTVASQTVAPNTTVSGNGTISGNSLTFSYTIQNTSLPPPANQPNSCTYVGTRL